MLDKKNILILVLVVLVIIFASLYFLRLKENFDSNTNNFDASKIVVLGQTLDKYSTTNNGWSKIFNDYFKKNLNRNNPEVRKAIQSMNWMQDFTQKNGDILQLFINLQQQGILNGQVVKTS